MLLELVGGVA